MSNLDLKMIQMLVPVAKYGVKCPYAMTPQYVTIHNTANNASALAEISYMIGNWEEVSYHWAVDDVQAIQAIEHNHVYRLRRHYDLLAKLRIRLSNREAMGYLWIGMATAVLFGITVTQLATTDNVQAGHIYAVITYLWTFAMSLDDAPRLLEQFSNLKDIGKRVEV